MLWLRADEGVTTSGSTVTEWIDQSGNGNDATRSNGDPVLRNDAFNGEPAVEFAASDRDVLSLPSSGGLGDLATGDNTLILVSKSTGSEENQFALTFDNSTCPPGPCTPARGTIDLRGIGYNARLTVEGATGNLNLVAISGDEEEREAFSQTVSTSDPHVVSSVFEGSAVRQDLVVNNTLEQSTNRANPIRDRANDVFLGRTGDTTRQLLGDAGTDNGFFSGEIAEVIAYDEALNAAQVRIVHNYLAEKYGIRIARDFYTYSGNDTDVAGLGQANSSLGDAPKGAHTTANSAELRLRAASGLGDGEYILFGHDDAAVSFSQAERPNGQTTAQKVDREWRVDLTGASSQSVDVSVARADLPSQPDGFNDYALFVDEDGDFSSGATFVDLERNGTRYEATDVQIEEGDYVTIAAIQRTITFAEAGTTDFEDTSTSTPALPLALNYPSQSDLSLEYSVSPGANGPTIGTDYETCCGGRTAQFTIPAGRTTYNLQNDAGGPPPLRVLDDTNPEDNTEFVDIAVDPGSGPSAGRVAAGDVTTFEFGIVDDELSRKASLSAPSASVAEDSGSNLTVNVNLTSDAGRDVTIDYELSGSATAGEDYENLEAGSVDATSGTVTIPTGQQSTSFDLNVLDDDTFEPDEEIVVTLVSAENGTTLRKDGGERPRQTLTIVDNESAPTVSLSSQTFTGREGTQASAIVQLSAAAGTDVNVQFGVSDGSATGSDYTTVTASPVTIPAGQTEASILFDLARDDGKEATETFSVTLTGTQNGNATLASPQSADVDIIDADGVGGDGPGGVGNSQSVAVWLSADRLSLSDGSAVTAWPDRSGNGNGATVSSGNAPIFKSGVGAFNDRPVVRFDGSEDYLNLSGVEDLGQGPNTVFAVSSTTPATRQGILTVADVDPLGGTVTDRRILRYNAGPTGGEVEALNGGGVAETAVSAGTPAVLGSGFGGTTVDVAANRGAPTTSKTVGTGTGTSAVLGAEIGLSVDNSETRENFLDGDLAEVVVFNRALIEAQRTIVANALAAKYGIALTNGDYYAGDTSAGFEERVIGIGAEGASLSDQHTQAEGAGVRLVANSLSAGEYVFVGDTTHAASNDINVKDVEGVSGVTARAEHLRYLDTRGQPTFDVTINLEAFGLQGPSGRASNYRLLYRGRSDGGTWSTPATVAGRSASGDEVTFSGVQFGAADEAVYITVGTTNQVASPLDTRLTTVRGTPGTDGSDEGWRFYGPPGSREGGPVQMGEIRLRTDGGRLQSVDFRVNMSYTWSRSGDQWVPASADTEVPAGRGSIIFLYDDKYVPLDPSLTIDPKENGTNGAFSYTGNTDVTVGDAVPTPADSPLGEGTDSHLLANPYEVAYDLRGLQTLNQDGDGDNINDWGTTVYVWNTFAGEGSGDPRGTYQLRSTDPAKPQTERMLSPGQAFFLERNDTVDNGGGLKTQITFSADGREEDEVVEFVGTKKAMRSKQTRRAGQIKLRLQVRGKDGQLLARDRAAALYFREGATADWDAFDAPKLKPMADSYATIGIKGAGQGGTTTLKAQESRPYVLEEPVEVPLTLNTEGVSGTATLSAAEWWSIPADWSLTIIDTKGTRDPSDDVEHTLGRGGRTPYTFSVEDDESADKSADGTTTSASEPHVPTPVRQRTGQASAAKSAGEERFVLRVEPGKDALQEELETLNTEIEGRTAILQWTASSETNSTGFYVEHQRLTKGDTTVSEEAWQETGFVEGGGTNKEAQNYKHRVSGLQPGRHVFRLRLVNANGTATYSQKVETNVRFEEGVRGPNPNPVEQRATLLVTVRDPQPVTVTLYDMLGRRIRTIYDDELEARRTRRIRVTTDDLASGIYFMRVKGEDFTETARMTVVK